MCIKTTLEKFSHLLVFDRIIHRTLSTLCQVVIRISDPTYVVSKTLFSVHDSHIVMLSISFTEIVAEWIIPLKHLSNAIFVSLIEVMLIDLVE